MSEKKYVYFFGKGKAEGTPSMKPFLGGKGANLAEMTNIGIPVPPGFTISAEVCDYFNKNSFTYPEGTDRQIDDAIARLEDAVGAKFGDKANPMLVSVRSGAAVSMPGMMDTVLNLGLNDETVEGLAKRTNNPRMAWDSFRRFIDMFSDVVMGVDHHHFEQKLSEIKKQAGVTEDTQLSADQLKHAALEFKKIYEKHIGKPFPSNPREQLAHSIRAVFESWNRDKAIAYRRINKIDNLLGTAVNVQAMVFGNMGDNSGTGVAFTRNPATGTNEFFGEFLINAQGEDVVAGIRTPIHIDELAKKWPTVMEQLLGIRSKLEKHYREMQDIEFTIQDGVLYMLQTRTGQRTGGAAVQVAIDMVEEGLITHKEALKRVSGDQLSQLLFPVLDPQGKKDAVKAGNCVGKGLPAGPGAATGAVVLTPEEAERRKAKGEKVILVRHETSPEDVSGMWAAEGILTSTGGMTSHAAVVARGWGKCCVVGMAELKIDYATKTCEIAGRTFKEGDSVSIDGSTGELILANLATRPSPVIAGVVDGDKEAQATTTYKNFNKLMQWADEVRRLRVRTNADTPADARVAVKFGAEGIGLCRTEHMFFEGERIWAIREFILAVDEAGRKKALEKLLPYQRSDFEGIFEAMEGRPVTIRLLDPPLHEFLPNDEKGQKEMATRMNLTEKRIQELVKENHEFNPMLGNRGCRLSITFPELAVMQSTAIIEAAINISKKGTPVSPEIMIPLIGTKAELDYLANIIRAVADDLLKKSGAKVDYKVGTMIEIPRAALRADQIAESAEFFSFGTNDLTQMLFGYSRDDAGSFLPGYVEKKILPVDPFQVIDREGVGEIMKIAVEKGRKVKPGLKLGICGEHGGEPNSVKFCHILGLDYVSCSPYRLPIARLAAAQAVIEGESK
jgi:pyruvate,orthophosphate dikinase